MILPSLPVSQKGEVEQLMINAGWIDRQRYVLRKNRIAGFVLPQPIYSNLPLTLTRCYSADILMNYKVNCRRFQLCPSHRTAAAKRCGLIQRL